MDEVKIRNIMAVIHTPTSGPPRDETTLLFTAKLKVMQSLYRPG
jgi:hypothetical protein